MKMMNRIGSLLLMASCILSLSAMKAAAVFETGFESPTYTSGALDGQDSWSGGSAAFVRTESEIMTELTNAGLNPADAVHGGSQAVLVTGTGGSSASIRPIPGFVSATRAVLDLWARPLSPGSSGSNVGANVGNIFMTMEDSNGASGRAAAFRFGASLDGSGQLDTTSIDVFSEGSGWITTGIQWQPDTWYNIRLDADYSTKTYDAYVDGVQVHSGIDFFNTASTHLSQIRVFRGSGQAGMILDDLSIVPEPTAFGLAFLAFCSLMLLKQRK